MAAPAGHGGGLWAHVLGLGLLQGDQGAPWNALHAAQGQHPLPTTWTLLGKGSPLRGKDGPQLLACIIASLGTPAVVLIRSSHLG